MERKEGRSKVDLFDLKDRIFRGQMNLLGLVLIDRMGIGRCGAHPSADKAGVLSGMVAVVIVVEGMFFRPDHDQACQGEVDQCKEEGGLFDVGDFFHDHFTGLLTLFIKLSSYSVFFSIH